MPQYSIAKHRLLQIKYEMKVQSNKSNRVSEMPITCSRFTGNELDKPRDLGQGHTFRWI